ncbi:FAD-dependent oxidoreductase, partial [bacterium]|nr:FAD-dependent oxidoreductase [bacterium]
NNVETWANIPVIVSRGAEWFSSIGSPGSKGTKVFSLVGNIKNTGLVEVPMGMPLWDIVFRIGGGITRWREFKGVQTGGPSGGCLPAKLLNLPVDFDRLTEAGSMMGSGSMIIMDEHTCMVDMAKYFLSFTADESCGKCTPCREGIPRMFEILDKISLGEGEEGDLERLEDLGIFIKENSLCGLGQTAPNPLLTTLRYYRDDYEAHVKYKRCPGGVCKKIVSSPCHHTCPVDMDAPSYIAYIAEGKFDKALEVIHQATPFAGICSRICPHPCEYRCTSGNAGEPISIRALKRFVLEKHGNGYSPPKGSGKLEKVAIIGAGPAGLNCAWDLARLGYRVTVFESLDVAGGMLYTGIPAFRLPRELIAEEVERVRRVGVEIKTGVKVGEDVSFEDLQRDYKAIFIATGAHAGTPMNIEGEEVEGVQDAIDFLHEVNVRGRTEVGRRVGIIGGNNTALDAARTALRLGAEKVTVYYNRTHFEIPADELEVNAGLEEGIEVFFLCAPKGIITENGRLKALECVQVEMKGVDPSGWREPVAIEGSEFTVELDTL